MIRTGTSLLNAARAQQLPILAICRGVQLLNVACGGTLVQDIPSQITGALPHEVPVEIPDAAPAESEPVEPTAIEEVLETAPPEVEPIPIDTTAELLGRAKHRKPRVRALSSPVAPTPRPAARASRGQKAPKKAATPRRSSHRA